MTLKEMKDLPIGEVYDVEEPEDGKRTTTDLGVTRVPGGWLYFIDGMNGKALCFVPEPKEEA